MDWQKLESKLDKIAGQIKTKPDRILAAKLNIDSMFCINVEKHGNSRRVTSEILTNISGHNILLVEDALESGKSLIAAKKNLESKGAIVQTLALYILPGSEIKPDYYLETKEQIPKFPWE